MSTLIPDDFWSQIDHQLARISEEKPATFDDVRAILLDLNYDQIVLETHRNRPRPFDTNSAFFAGSGGDATVLNALRDAGWHIRVYRTSYHYSVIHERSGEALTYIEGDVVRGDQFPIG